MKTTKIIIYLCLCVLISNTFAQENPEANRKIDELYSLLNMTESSDKNVINNEKLQLSDHELEKAKDLLYYSYAHAPVEFQKRKDSLHKNWRETGRKTERPNKQIKKLEKALGEKYGRDFCGYLKTPYVLQIRIREITRTTYPEKTRARGKVPQINLKVEILDILKGKSYFCVGDLITVAYLPIWFFDDGVSPEFKIDEVYVVPLNYWHNNEDNILQLRLQGLHTLYKIKNDNVFSPLISEDKVIKSWIDFKNNFMNEYILDKEG
jgi:hypothetical protein